MRTKAEITAEYKTNHSNLETLFYRDGGLSKAEFDQRHGQNWLDYEAEMIAAGHIQPPQPVRDMAAELDELKTKLKTAGVIN